MTTQPTAQSVLTRQEIVSQKRDLGLSAVGASRDKCSPGRSVKLEQVLDQGIADSDGTVRPSEIVITSVPNADFVTALLRGLGMTTAHTTYEKGIPLRTTVNRKQASTLPIFSEFVKSYRYQHMLY